MNKLENGVKFNSEVDKQLMQDLKDKMTIQQVAKKYQESEFYIEKRIEFLQKLHHRVKV